MSATHQCPNCNTVYTEQQLEAIANEEKPCPICGKYDSPIDFAENVLHDPELADILISKRNNEWLK